MNQEAKRARLLSALMLTMSMAATFGCADSGMLQVAGKVTIDGEPVVQGTIGFFPADGQGPSAEAVIDGGAYSVSIMPGKKKVVIHGYQQVGEKFPWGKDGQAMPILEEIVPASFNAGSKLVADIQADQRDRHFELSSSADGTGP